MSGPGPAARGRAVPCAIWCSDPIGRLPIVIVVPRERVRCGQARAAAGAAARPRRPAAARTSRGRSGRVARTPPAVCTRDSYSAGFTPVVPGVHRVFVTLDTPDVPVLHVRVGDEQKTDGVRTPGY